MKNPEENGKREPGQEDSRVSYRSGVAARLAGLSAETLRVWERRYKLSDTQRSARGQRLYSTEQVRRLGLLKQLVDQGHAISVLASLPIDRLQELIAGHVGEQKAEGPIRVAVVGGGLARRIAADGREGLDIAVQCSCQRFEQAGSLPRDADVELLLVELSELDESAVPQVLAARDACAATAVVVLYRFCASATIRALRAHGCLAARIPAELGELLVLCRSALAGERLPPLHQPGVPKVRFDDELLAAITAAGNRLACECPRHLSDLLLMVGSFERYSAQCASRNAEDARLHQELERAAGHARAILEGAMEQLVRAEGLLPLPEKPGRI